MVQLIRCEHAMSRIGAANLRAISYGQCLAAGDRVGLGANGDLGWSRAVSRIEVGREGGIRREVRGATISAVFSPITVVHDAGSRCRSRKAKGRDESLNVLHRERKWLM